MKRVGLLTMTVCTLFNDMVVDVLDPVKVKKHFDRIGHFRILVLGRYNDPLAACLQHNRAPGGLQC